MTDRMQNKIVLVTGAGSIGKGWGNGKAASVLYAREGAQVIACDINIDAANETVELINKDEVLKGEIPTDQHSYHIDEKELSKIDV